MAKIAFFLNLGRFCERLQSVQLERGNPGIGGTPYLFLLTIKHLNKIYGRDYAIMLSDSYFGLDDDDVNNAAVKDEMGALDYCERNGICMLVINANVADRVPSAFYKTSVRIVLWAHNTVSFNVAQIAAEQKSVHKIVCVSQQQLNNMSDSRCFYKCICINNILPSFFLKNAIVSDCSEKKVAYVGSIVPQKGAHNLLKIWKYVEKKVPEAELYIFGGAKIWDPTQRCGCIGIGDFFYDKVLKRALDRLQAPQKVHFMGAMGWSEIEHIIKTFRVGVVNPSHYMRDETFCMSAVELAAHGIPVVSRYRKDGLLSTIKSDETGFLEEKDEEIADRIIELLCNDDECKNLGTNASAFSWNFVAENEIYKWKELIDYKDFLDQPQKNGKAFSTDILWLWHDLLLKIMYTVFSGKVFYLLRKKMQRK